MSGFHRSIDWGDRLPTLEGRDVRLRMLEDRDIDGLFAIFSDAAVMRYWSSPPLADRAAAHALYEEIVDLFRLRALFQWGIARKTDDRLIGTITVHRLDVAHGRAEVGFAVARGSWRQGVAKDALARLLRFAFEELGLHRLEADADPRNAACLALLEGLGFVREGLAPERYHVLCQWQDAVLLGLLESRWKKQVDADRSRSGA